MDIISILDEKNIPYAKTNNPVEIKIKCTSGLHEDSDPSLAYNIESHIFNCWSCGFKGGSKKLLESLGIKTTLKLETKLPYKVLKLKKKLSLLISDGEVTLPFSRDKITQEFKNISIPVLRDFQAFHTIEYGLEDYICVPVYQYNKLRFIEARNKFANSKKSKYQRKPAGVSVSDILFPLDKLANTNRVVVVEGLYDMLNCWQHGYTNVLCMFGASNFGPKKVELLNSIGITTVDIMMDGDEPGQKAAVQIANYLDKADIAPNLIRLPEDKDPGVLTAEELAYYLGTNSTRQLG